MNNALKKELRKYFNEIKVNLNCKYYLKLGFMSSIKESVSYFLDTIDETERTIENVRNKFGTPNEIAASFDMIEDLSDLRKKSKKIIITQARVIVAMTIVIALLIFIICDLLANGDHHAIVDNNF